MSYTLTSIRSFSSFTSSPHTVVATAGVSTGDLVIFGIQCGTTATLTVSSITDNDITGHTNYRQLGTVNDATNGNALQIWAKQAASSYTPSWIVTYSGVGGSTVASFGAKVNSTSSTMWTIDSQFPIYTNAATVANTSMPWNPGNTLHNNEVVIVQSRENASISGASISANWLNVGGNFDLFVQLFASAGSSANDTLTWTSPNSLWDNLVAAVYDFPGIGDDLSSLSTQDLVLYNNSWTYAQGATNTIKVGTTGAICGAGTNPGLAYWNAIGFTADQQAQCRINSFGIANGLGGVAVRLSAGTSGANGYAVYLDSAHYNIVLFNNGAASSISGGLQSLSSNVGDTINLTVRGNQITFSKNGTTIKTVTDSTIGSGAPGIAFNGQGVNSSTTIDTFRAGSFGINLPSLAVNSTIGTIGEVSGHGLTARTASFTEGSLADSLSVTLTPPIGNMVGANSPTTGGVANTTGAFLTWFPFTATASGSATFLNAYIRNTLSSTGLYLGLYDGLGNLLASANGSITTGLNTFSISPTTISAGANYSLAWLSAGGGGFLTVNDGSTTTGFLAGSVTTPPLPATLPASTNNPTTGIPSIFVSGTSGNTAAFIEGSLVNVIPISGQTGTFTEGSINAFVSGDQSFTFGSQSAQLSQGQFFDEIDYLLDQGASVVNLFSQTATFAPVVIPPIEVDQFPPAYTLTSSEGTIGPEAIADTLGASTIVSSEGQISANAGQNVANQLSPQSLSSSEGIISATAAVALTNQTLTSIEGTITFQNQSGILPLFGQTAAFSLGQFFPVLLQGGYPNLAGMLLEEAIQQLESSGAVVPASIGYFGTWPVSAIWVPSQSPPFVVIAQSIPPTAPIIANQPVTLTVSQPPESVAYP